MPMIKLLQTVFILIIISTQTGFAENNQDSRHLIKSILQNSGITKQTLSMNDLIVQKINKHLQPKKKFDNNKKREFIKILTEEFDAAVILANIEKDLNEQLTPEELLALDKFYKKPLIKKISLAEQEASSAEGMAAMQKFAQKLQNEPPTPERKQLMQRMDQSMEITETGVQIASGFIKGIIIAFEGSISDKKSKEIRNSVYKPLQNYALFVLLYTYRDFSDSEIKEYLHYYDENKSLKKLLKIVFANYSRGFNEWGQRSAIRLKKTAEGR